MEEINENDFLALLQSEEQSEYNDLIVNFSKGTDVDLSKIAHSNKFKNCRFYGHRLDFLNSKLTNESKLTHRFLFDNCEFNNDVFFKNCYLSEIVFLNISKQIKNFHLAAEKIGYFQFECKEDIDEAIKYDINLTLHHCEIVSGLYFLHIKSSNNLFISRCKINQFKIHDSEFKRIDIDHCDFSSEFQFTANTTNDSYIKDNQFENSDFSLTNFGTDAEFKNNNFKGTALFQRLKNENTTRVKFKNCIFFKYTNFNNSKLDSLRIDTSKFHEFASFQDIELHTIFLDRTIFEKPAFFDDIEIHNFIKCDKRTLRNIKQQLLRADNKIDYDIFRAHELNSYKNDLTSKLKSNPKKNKKKLRRDLAILKVNYFFSNNGTDWFKAVKRTLIVAILFYSTFYILYNSDRELALTNTKAINEYLIGLFRYFLITDFHNPLLDNREYLKEFTQWIPFLLGKIFIAIGIYEILVSFRKFRK